MTSLKIESRYCEVCEVTTLICPHCGQSSCSPICGVLPDGELCYHEEMFEAEAGLKKPTETH
jgi:hypothetical protein